MKLLWRAAVPHGCIFSANANDAQTRQVFIMLLPRLGNCCWMVAAHPPVHTRQCAQVRAVFRRSAEASRLQGERKILPIEQPARQWWKGLFVWRLQWHRIRAREVERHLGAGSVQHPQLDEGECGARLGTSCGLSFLQLIMLSCGVKV